MFFNIKNLERTATFPAEGKKLIHDIEINPEIEEINVKMADGNIINGIYLGN